LNIAIEAGIIITGDIDEMDETMSVAVCCTTISEKVTPIKGPNIAQRIKLKTAL